jgi:CSLREA domain-containing protein
MHACKAKCFLRSALVLAAVAASVLPAVPARATVITVTTTDDEVNADGDCSLREAVIAANTNAVVDACTAGEGAATDVLDLDPGATYLLTLPQPALPADDPLGGNLNVADNAADPDLRIDGELATIRQTVQGQEVVRVLGSAELAAVVVSGGSAAGCGSGILFLGSGTSSVEGSVFTRNAALNGAAICNASSGSTLVVTGSTFVENQAGGANGGAINNLNGTTSIVGSVFLRNLAGLTGGAVHNNRDVADAVTIEGSCFLDNSDVAVSNGKPALQTAAGNWWGSSSGPSGAGPGGGDSVDATYDFSGFATAPPAECFPMETLRNARFELTEGGSGPLQSWKTSGLTGEDGQACGDPFDCVLLLAGDGTVKRVSQVVRIAGSAGDVLTFTASSRAKDVPIAPGPYRVRATIFHVDGSREVKNIKFSSGTHGLETVTKTIVPSEDWKKVRVEISYGKPGGTVRFDDVSLTFGEPVP